MENDLWCHKLNYLCYVVRAEKCSEAEFDFSIRRCYTAAMVYILNARRMEISTLHLMKSLCSQHVRFRSKINVNIQFSTCWIYIALFVSLWNMFSGFVSDQILTHFNTYILVELLIFSSLQLHSSHITHTHTHCYYHIHQALILQLANYKQIFSKKKTVSTSLIELTSWIVRLSNFWSLFILMLIDYIFYYFPLFF